MRNGPEPPPSTLDAILRWPSAEAREWVTALLDWCLRLGRLRAVVAVGSAIRSGVPSRDVDLVLVHGPERPEFPAPPRDVEVTLFDEGELDRLAEAGNDLVGWALRFGRVLYEQDGCWTAVEGRWRGRLPLPSPDEAARRARRRARSLAALRAAGNEAAVRAELVGLLTQEARSRLLRAGVFPASRPELPGQLRAVGEEDVADLLEDAAAGRADAGRVLAALGLEEPSPGWTPG